MVDRALERLAASRNELRDLDAALGDGDLGVTVSRGCEAVRVKLGGLDDPSPGQVLRTVGSAFANANPSTMAALVGGGLLAAAKVVDDQDDLGRADAVRIVRAAADSIAARGKSELGDKTILDAIIPSLVALEVSTEATGPVMAAMVAAAARAVEETALLQSRRGRAAWVGERSIGHPDPGATAYLRLLEAIIAVWPDRRDR
ncbi:MAG: DAK2 domain-containing protein [Actinomycetes bacterium]